MKKEINWKAQYVVFEKKIALWASLHLDLTLKK